MPFILYSAFFISHLLNQEPNTDNCNTQRLLINSLTLLASDNKQLHNAARFFKVSTVIAMACSKMSKITKQHEKTWSLLHKRLMEMEFNFQELFNDNVWEFLQKKAASLSTSVGYLVPCILTSTAFVASTGSLISHKQHEIPFNL